jgi:predicted nucleic acid-binding protein
MSNRKTNMSLGLDANVPACAEGVNGAGLSIWDAVIYSAARAAGCRLLLSEDLQTGFNWNADGD